MRHLWAEAAKVMSESYFADSATHRLSSLLQEGEGTSWTVFWSLFFLAQWDLVAKKHLISVISLSYKNFNSVSSSQWLITHILQDISIILLKN